MESDEPRRWRVAGPLLGVLLVVTVGVSAVAIVKHRDRGRGAVVRSDGKEVSLTRLTHVQLIVVPASTRVAAMLDTSSVVARYAGLSRGVRGYELPPASIRPALCELEGSDGYAVQTSRPVSGAARRLRQSLAGAASVFDVSAALGDDLQIVMRPGTTPKAISIVRARLTSDPEVQGFRYVDRARAYTIFERDFPSQAAATRQQDPRFTASFSVDVNDGASIAEMRNRYGRLGGVGAVTTFDGTTMAMTSKTAAAVPAAAGHSNCNRP